MSDEYMGDASPEPEAGQPSADVQPDAQEGAKPEPITLDILQKVLAENNEQLLRKVQSLNDKQDARVDKRLDKWTASLENQGIRVTSDMKDRKKIELAMQEADRAIAEEDSAQLPSQQKATGPDPAVVKQTNEAMRALQKKYGYALTQNDPEFWEVPFQDSTPQEFLVKYEAGLKDVVTRLGRPLPAETAQTPTNPASRIPAPIGAPVGGIDSMTAELNKLQDKVGRTALDNKRLKELTAELVKHIPKQ